MNTGNGTGNVTGNIDFGGPGVIDRGRFLICEGEGRRRCVGVDVCFVFLASEVYRKVV